MGAPRESQAVAHALSVYEDDPGQSWYLNYQDDFMRAAKSLGYDCVVFTDARGGGGVATSYVVFDPAQIHILRGIAHEEERRVSLPLPHCQPQAPEFSV